MWCHTLRKIMFEVEIKISLIYCYNWILHSIKLIQIYRWSLSIRLALKLKFQLRKEKIPYLPLVKGFSANIFGLAPHIIILISRLRTVFSVNLDNQILTTWDNAKALCQICNVLLSKFHFLFSKPLYKWNEGYLQFNSVRWI